MARAPGGSRPRVGPARRESYAAGVSGGSVGGPRRVLRKHSDASLRAAFSEDVTRADLANARVGRVDPARAGKVVPLGHYVPEMASAQADGASRGEKWPASVRWWSVAEAK